MNKTIKKILNLSLLLVCVGTVSGCRSINSRLGIDSTDYACAQEMPPLKLPEGALAVSKRYDIPAISGNNNPIITENLPPDY